MNTTRLIVTLGLISILLACASSVKMNASAFFQQPLPANASIIVVHADESINASLEFDYYRQKVLAKFTAFGFQVADNAEDAQLAAIMSYGIDSGKT